MVEIVVLVLGFIVGILTNIVGGGFGALVIPILIWLGLSPITAIGTLKTGGFGLMIGSTAGFHVNDAIDKRNLKPLLVVALVASVIGPSITTKLDESVAQTVIGVFIILTSLTLIFGLRAAGNLKTEPSPMRKAIGLLLFFIVLLSVTAFSSGLGLAVSVVLMMFFGMTAIGAVAVRRLIGLITLPIEVFIFANAGFVDYSMGISMAFGMLVGGYIGAHTAVRLGNEMVKRAMGVMALALGLSLFFR